MNATDTLARLRAEIPGAGLFAEKDWLLSHGGTIFHA